jgi:hypothetical protein
MDQYKITKIAKLFFKFAQCNSQEGQLLDLGCNLLLMLSLGSLKAFSSPDQA